MSNTLFIGLMSGTSMDGIDAALLDFSANQPQIIATHSLPYNPALRAALLALQYPSHNELENTALLSNQLAELYAQTVNQLLQKTSIDKQQITAIGSHGQTIRHRPELGFSMQIGNPALLTELTGIKVVADFRSRDVAAGGQGAPLVPAFHHGVFANPRMNRVIVNIGGIANLSYLPATGTVIGFDSGPGNMLMDAWCNKHFGKPYDQDGEWAASGKLIPALLEKWTTHPYFQLPPPKSTGRDLFNLSWLQQFVENHQAQDIQRTLLEFTALTITNAIRDYCPHTEEIYLCGGGAHNHALFQCLQHLLHPVKIGVTDELGIAVNWVEAAAFAWLARQTILQQPGNLPAVTGARGLRVLGAVYAS